MANRLIARAFTTTPIRSRNMRREGAAAISFDCDCFSKEVASGIRVLLLEISRRTIGLGALPGVSPQATRRHRKPVVRQASLLDILASSDDQGQDARQWSAFVMIGR